MSSFFVHIKVSCRDGSVPLGLRCCHQGSFAAHHFEIGDLSDWSEFDFCDFWTSCSFKRYMNIYVYIYIWGELCKNCTPHSWLFLSAFLNWSRCYFLEKTCQLTWSMWALGATYSESGTWHCLAFAGWSACRCRVDAEIAWNSSPSQNAFQMFPDVSSSPWLQSPDLLHVGCSWFISLIST